MNESINSSHYLYNKYDDISSLELTVRNHPSSSIARFLLLKQYQQTDSPRLSDYAAQTALYFSNPQWLSFQLLRTELESTEVLLQAEASILEQGEQEGTDLLEDSVINEEVAPGNILTTSAKVEIEPEEEDKAETDDFTQNDSESLEKDSLEENKNSLAGTELHSSVDSNTDSAPDADSKVEKASNEKADEEELIFEPLHTSDYFASQGVTIKEEALMNDKLGKQMRSFSEWLKSMKQLHPNKLPEQNEVIERIIQSSAEQSNVESEVLTEAMAEVLLKQDKQQKAIEMYEKLSLMNPSKSIYFAAKIDKIKNK